MYTHQLANCAKGKRGPHTCWGEVANGVRQGLVRTAVLQVLAGVCYTANMGRVLPHNLSEMAVLLKVTTGMGLTIVWLKETLLIVVHHVGDHSVDMFGGNTKADVLTITATAKVPVNYFG